MLAGDQPVTADLLVTRRNVSVDVELTDATGQAIGRAGFHWVVVRGRRPPRALEAGRTST